MMPRNDEKATPPKLPDWASITRQEKASKKGYDEEALFVREEEPYLRHRVFRFVSDRIDRAVAYAARQHTAPLCQDIQSFWDAHLPRNAAFAESSSLFTPLRNKPSDHNSTAAKTPMDELRDLLAIDESPMDDDNDPETDQYGIKPGVHFSHKILPVAMVGCPASTLDRAQYVQSVANCFHKNRPAVCVLNKMQNFNHHGSMLQEMLQQCVQREPHPEYFSKVVKQTKRFSASQALLTWGSHTVSFDSLVVLMENPEAMSPAVLEGFMKALTSLRCQHGLPVNVVLFVIQDSRRDIELRSSVEGNMGMNTMHFSLPSSRVLYERIWELLFVDPKHRLPILFPPSVLGCIHETFVNHSGSAIRAATMMKQTLAFHFQQPGSFFAATECVEIMNQEWRRLAWFCVNQQAREAVIGAEHESADGAMVLKWLQEIEKHRRELRMVLQLLRHLFCKGQRSMPEWMGDALKGRLAQERFSGIVKGMHRMELLSILARCKRELSVQDARQKSEERRTFEHYVGSSDLIDATSESWTQDLAERLCEITLLVDRGYLTNEEGRPVVDNGLEITLDEFVHTVFRKGWTIIDKMSKESNPLKRSLIMSESNATLAVDSIKSELRKSVAAALVFPPQHDLVASVPSEMLRVIRTRVEIARDEWFHLFLENVKTDKSEEELWSMFAFGIYELLHCGLIREKRGYSKGEHVYEKAALVWCSGM